MLTLLLYFNDVEEGGETAFPFVTPLGTPTNRHLVPEELYGGNNDLILLLMIKLEMFVNGLTF